MVPLSYLFSMTSINIALLSLFFMPKYRTKGKDFFLSYWGGKLMAHLLLKRNLKSQKGGENRQTQNSIKAEWSEDSL